MHLYFTINGLYHDHRNANFNISIEHFALLNDNLYNNDAYFIYKNVQKILQIYYYDIFYSFPWTNCNSINDI